MLSHRSLKLSSLYFVFFLLFFLANFSFPVFQSTVVFFPLFLHLVCFSTFWCIFSFSYCSLDFCDFCLVLSFIFSVFLEFFLCLSILFPSSVSVFVTIILNSLLGKLFISVLLTFLSGIFILFFFLEHIPLFPHFSWFSVFVSMFGQHTCLF